MVIITFGVWITREVLDRLNNVNNPSSIHTYDFSTLC